MCDVTLVLVYHHRVRNVLEASGTRVRYPVVVEGLFCLLTQGFFVYLNIPSWIITLPRVTGGSPAFTGDPA